MRTDPPFHADERTTLVWFLAYQRATLERKCAGLDATALARRAVEPSALSLLGLVRHLAEVEREYARHNGHADLLRERIDGVVGE